MIIFDSIAYEKYSKLRKTLEKKGISCVKISDINPEQKYDDALCVFSLVLSFFDTDAFEFLRSQKNFKTLSIILTVERSYASGRLLSSSVATDWVHALVGPRVKVMQVIAAIYEKDTEYLYSLIENHMFPKDTKKKQVYEIYTDGSCLGNPGCGGWAAVIKTGGKTTELTGGVYNTTNNRMEIMAALKALESIKEPSKVVIYSDSAYLVNAFELGWLEQWKQSRWRNSDRVLVKNIDLWQKIDELVSFHDVKFSKVKGHADVKLNNLCDRLAVEESRKMQSLHEDD